MTHGMAERELYGSRYDPNEAITLTLQKCEFFECFRVGKVAIGRLTSDTFLVNSITLKFDLKEEYERGRIPMYIHILSYKNGF